MNFLIQLAFLWVIWLVSPRRWQRLLGILFAVITIVGASVSAWGVQLALWGLTVWLPPDRGETTDAIVVLGRGEAFRDLRTGVTQELWQAQRAPQVFASGMMDARPIVQSLQELGIPASQLSGEECSRSTQENALFTAALLPASQVQRRAQRILLVTDKPHMLRSLLIFRRVGFQVVSHAVPMPIQSKLWEQQRYLLREYLALIAYIMTGKSTESVPKEPISASLEVTERIRDWNCWIQGTT